MTIFANNRPLLDGFRRGDRTALSEVYGACVGDVVQTLRHGFLFRSRGSLSRFRGFSDPLELESFVQDVFLRAFSEKARLAYDGIRPYEPYLMTIARNVVIDELRERQSAVERLVDTSDDPNQEPVSSDPPLDVQVDADRLKSLVRDFVGSLDDLERRYVEARFENDLSMLAAARELGITRMRARVLERRLLRSLWKKLQRSGYFDATNISCATLLGLV